MRVLFISFCFVFALAVNCYAEYDIEELPCDGFFGSILNKCIVQPEQSPVPDVKSAEDLVFGAKADAPNLILLPYNFSLGVEGGKDLLGTSLSEGWFVFGKVTWNGTLVNLSGQ
jgi:hypothetical protein